MNSSHVKILLECKNISRYCRGADHYKGWEPLLLREGWWQERHLPYHKNAGICFGESGIILI